MRNSMPFDWKGLQAAIKAYNDLPKEKKSEVCEMSEHRPRKDSEELTAVDVDTTELYRQAMNEGDLSAPIDKLEEVLSSMLGEAEDPKRIASNLYLASDLDKLRLCMALLESMSAEPVSSDCYTLRHAKDTLSELITVLTV